MKKVIIGFVLTVASFHFGETVIHAQSIRVDNTAKYSSGRYTWTIFLVADDATLNSIDYVQYTLHPSFPNPVQPPIKDRGGKCAFALSSESWGEFEVKVKIGFRNGTTTDLKHWLTLLQNKNQSGCTVSKAAAQRARVSRRR